MTTESYVHAERVKSEVPGQWFSVDFHVHSPASRDFEGSRFGDSEDDEGKRYFWLLEQACQASLSIIAITDHNEIEGYQKLIQLSEDLKRTERSLARANVPIPDEIKHQIGLFEKVVILPGVELDIKPGLHSLVMFDPQASIEQIEDFLVRAGYPRDRRRNETASQYAEWDLQETCREAEKLGAFAIAAHVDSTSGLYETTKHLPGHVRISAFRMALVHQSNFNGFHREGSPPSNLVGSEIDEVSTEKWNHSPLSIQKTIHAPKPFRIPNLYAMEFVNPVARDQIRNLLKDPHYERETPIAFVQSSDFHGRKDQQIGARRTWIRLDEVKWESSEVFGAIKRALRNPDEYISAPGRPEVEEILKRLDENPCISDLCTPADKLRLAQNVCAFANCEDGTIVIGRNEKGNWIGIECSDEKTLVGDIAQAISQVTPAPTYTVEVYSYYGSRVVATVRVAKLPKVYSVSTDDRAYLIVNGKTRPASIVEVAELAEEKLLHRYATLSITNRLAGLSKILKASKDSIDVLPIIRKVESRSVPFSELKLSRKHGAVSTEEIEELIAFEYNGFARGQVVVLAGSPVRLPDQYIRITAPLGEADLSQPPFDNMEKFGGPKLIIAPEGAVYFDDQDPVAIFASRWTPLIFQTPTHYDGPDLKFIASYLRSAIAIWYAARYLRSADYRKTKILENMPVPINSTQDVVRQVLDLTDELIEAERAFLAEEQPKISSANLTQDKVYDEIKRERLRAVEQHNERAGKLMAKIDRVFFELFGLRRAAVEVVQQELEVNAIKVFEDVLIKKEVLAE